MAPQQQGNSAHGQIITRSKNTLKTIQHSSKRKAECSPLKEMSESKRPALGELTNGPFTNHFTAVKSTHISKSVGKRNKCTLKDKHNNENLMPPPINPPTRITRAKAKTIILENNGTAIQVKDERKDYQNVMTKKKTRLSNEFNRTEDSLYTTALEEVNSSNHSLVNAASKNSKKSSLSGDDVTFAVTEIKSNLELHSRIVPENVVDYDEEHYDDIYQVSQYAMDIFDYLKDCEANYQIEDYMGRQPHLTIWMRALLIDWMVEVQESFELNHETLYLGVKLVDMFLSKNMTISDHLQLVGAAAMVVAAKYDDRIPPLLEDYIYICDSAYKREELIRMEMMVLKVCDFNLGMPISYRFLRRYARCANITMPVMTLARYVLELGLMDYHTVTLSDSKLASAALYLALQMKSISGWTRTLEFYSGYKLEDFITIAYLLNSNLHKIPNKQLMTVRNKYSHKIFFGVARTALIDDADLKP